MRVYTVNILTMRMMRFGLRGKASRAQTIRAASYCIPIGRNGKRKSLHFLVLYSTIMHERKVMDTPQGGFLISQIKQIDDDMPIVELARRTGLAKTTLTDMLNRMEHHR